jgi:hypothetical protein
MAVVSVYGILDAIGKPDVLSTILFTWGAVIFSSIAATGTFESSVFKPFQQRNTQMMKSILYP